MLKFQDQDFAELRKNFQNVLTERAMEEARKRQDQDPTGSNPGTHRPKRAAYEAAVNQIQDTHKQFTDARAAANKLRQHNKEIDGEMVVDMLPKKDNSIKLTKVHEFQFFDDFEALTQIQAKIQRTIENYELVSEHLKEQYQKQLETGFLEWSYVDYKQFFKAFMSYEIDDLEGIASEVDSKSVQEVAVYLRVFMQRYQELKEKD